MMTIRNNNESQVDLLLELIHTRMGLFYENGRRDLVLDKLSPLMADRGLDSIQDYYYLLKFSREAEMEWRRVETALAVNETYFWREFAQIEAVTNKILPDLSKKYPDRPVRIWHSACATGEEPYTMVMALFEAGVIDRYPVEIYASDINSEALAHARAAIFKKRSFRAVTPEITEKYFIQLNQGRHKLVDAVRERVHFFQLNLLDIERMHSLGKFDVIFCRNVFIYFSQEAINKVISGFYDRLNSPGYLFVAAAESLLKFQTDFELLEIENAFGYIKGEHE
jgi:chemotaxis protein methyltransferase CheR